MSTGSNMIPVRDSAQFAQYHFGITETSRSQCAAFCLQRIQIHSLNAVVRIKCWRVYRLQRNIEEWKQYQQQRQVKATVLSTCACLAVCSLVYFFVSLSVSVCLPVCLSVCLPACLSSVCLYLFLSLYICLSACFSPTPPSSLSHEQERAREREREREREKAGVCSGARAESHLLNLQQAPMCVTTCIMRARTKVTSPFVLSRFLFALLCFLSSTYWQSSAGQ